MNPIQLGIAALIVSSLPALASATGRGCENRGGNPEELLVVGLTDDQRLICFNEYQPRKAREIGAITGLQGNDTRLVGIDFRSATGALYGLGNAGGVYTLDTRDATATFQVQLNEALMGTSFGVDFNPTVDRLRIVSDAGQNLRADVTTGATTVDTSLTYPPNPALGIAGAAYTNNDADPNTATTLFDVDSNLDLVVIQAPPNNGSLNPTGKLTVEAGAAVGFDIFTEMRGGLARGARALASLSVGGRSGFYSVNLVTGRVRLRGRFTSSNQVIGIAISP